MQEKKESAVIRGEIVPRVWQPVKESIYEEFVLWSAMPPTERSRFGCQTQDEFCKKFNVGINTPTRWKRQPDFHKKVTELRHRWAFDKTSDVIYGIYTAALKGNDRSQKLWMQVFCGFTEKTENTVKAEVSLTLDDIRSIINILPEPLKIKHYANLRELLDDATALRRSGQIDESVWSTGHPLDLPGQTDNDAQNVPNKEADVLAVGDKKRIRQDLVGCAQTRDHQSAAWRWQEQADWDDWV